MKPIYVSFLLTLCFHFCFSQNNHEIAGKADSVTSHVKTSGDSIKQKGLTLIPEISFSRINFSGDNFSFLWGIGLTAGYQFNPHIVVGGGTGLEYNTDALYLPLYVAVRYNILKKRVTPFLTGEAGYGVVLKGGYTWYNGGFRYRAGIGIKIFISPKMALNFNTAFKYQEFHYKFGYAWWLSGPASHNYWVNGAYKLLDISIGMTF